MKTLGLIPPQGLHFKLVSELLSVFSKNWRDDYYRSLLNIPQDYPDQLTIKVANTLQEVEEAFEIVHDEYWEHGYIDKKSKEMLVTKFHLLPTTSVIVAQWEGKVIGTMSLINDSPMGLPSEGLQSFNDLRSQNLKKIAEGAFFAVKEEFQPAVTWPLIKFFYELSRRVHNVDILILPLPDNKMLTQFLEAVFFIKPLCEEAFTPHPYLNYGSIKLYLVNFAAIQLKLIKNYWKKPLHQDLFNFLHNHELSNLEFPNEITHQWSADHLREIFADSDELVKSLNDFEKLCLRQFYQEPIYENILPSFDPEVIDIEDRKRAHQTLTLNKDSSQKVAFYNREIRFETNAEGSIATSDRVSNIKIMDISLNGLRIKSDQHLKVGNNYKLKTKIDDKSVEINIRTIWAKKEQSLYGLRVEDHTDVWHKVIHYLIEKEQAS
ncbi:MAG: PilZ domain-containing protein [Bdellovibrionales bacterium]|nr:PilZ domain-containing protein [Bdellovibrionales bacterium]